MEIMKILKNHTNRSKGYILAILVSGFLWLIFTLILLTSCNTGRPLLNQPQFGLYDSDGRYVIFYPYAHNPRKLVAIPFIDPSYGRR
jgi:hypothetical protein